MQPDLLLPPHLSGRVLPLLQPHSDFYAPLGTHVGLCCNRLRAPLHHQTAMVCYSLAFSIFSGTSLLLRVDNLYKEYYGNFFIYLFSYSWHLTSVWPRDGTQYVLMKCNDISSISVLFILELHSYFSFGHIIIREKIRNKEEISIMLHIKQEKTPAHLLYNRNNGAALL